MNGISTAAPSQWWRSQRGWLLGALLLGTAAFVWPYHGALYEYQRWRPHAPIEVAKGEWGEYAGARWRLLGASLKTATGPGSRFNLERLDSAVLVLRFEVVPDPGTDPEKLDSCKGRLFDGDVREWDNNPLPLSRYRSPERLSAMCGSRRGADFKRQYAQPGQGFVFEHLYQLPRSVDWQRMHAGITVSNPELVPDTGSYLRFSLQ